MEGRVRERKGAQIGTELVPEICNVTFLTETDPVIVPCCTPVKSPSERLNRGTIMKARRLIASVLLLVVALACTDPPPTSVPAFPAPAASLIAGLLGATG